MDLSGGFLCTVTDARMIVVSQDNLLFSCCCARVDWTWSTVCDCYGGGYICGQDCIEDAVMKESAYYTVATVSLLLHQYL